MQITQNYLLYMGISALVCAIFHYFLARKEKRPLLLSLVTLLLGVILGVVCAKLLYFVVQIEYTLTEGALEALLSTQIDQFAYYGGVAGVCFGAALAGKIVGIKGIRALNIFAPAGALMAGLARFGESFFGLTFAGNLIENESLCFIPLAVVNEWEEWYWAVFVFAGLSSLAVFFFSLLKFGQHRFVRTLFYLCLPQILWESMRNQSFVIIEFVKVEQLLCMLLLETVLVLYGVWAKDRTKKPFLPAFVGLLCAGLFVALEFALDKTDIPHLATYAVMVLGLGVLGWMECIGFKKIAK